ncbi:MAG: hypothetical protein LUD12_14055 [Lachnospiraceae bacterium]|nr:hypothetical protein [Lachnospiraceae bacterium]
MDKESYYIKKLNPYYNTVGKEIPEETRTKISSSLKKMWEQMPEDKRKSIIENNLTGPKKGHPVSKETREKLSKWCSENQGKKVMIAETGMVFDQVKQLEQYLGACTGTYAAYKKGKIKTVKGFHVVECRD